MVYNHPEPIFEYNYITDGIYIGTNICCKTHFDERLIAEGITADISMEEKHLDMPYGVDFYTWIPVKDGSSPTFDQFDFGVATITKLVDMGKKVYIHCKNGHGRAPSMVAAYLISKCKKPDEAIDIIKSKRPTIHPEIVQLQGLEDFYSKISDKNQI